MLDARYYILDAICLMLHGSWLQGRTLGAGAAGGQGWVGRGEGVAWSRGPALEP